MEVEFRDDDLRRLEVDPLFTMGFPAGIVKAFRKRMQGIRAARDERDFYAMTSWRYEKLKGKRQHQRSMRLNDQYRLVLEIDSSWDAKTVTVVAIEDYH